MATPKTSLLNRGGDDEVDEQTKRVARRLGIPINGANDDEGEVKDPFYDEEGRVNKFVGTQTDEDREQQAQK